MVPLLHKDFISGEAARLMVRTALQYPKFPAADVVSWLTTNDWVANTVPAVQPSQRFLKFRKCSCFTNLVPCSLVLLLT